MIKVVKKAEEVTLGGLILPNTNDDPRAELAEVLGTDPKVTLVKQGDHILYKAYALSEIKIDDNIYGFLKEEDVIAVQEEA